MQRVTLLLTALFLLSACDWREFDDMATSATVQVIDGPDSYTGNIFGQVVTPLYEGNFKAPGLYVVGGTGEGGLALVDFRSGTPETILLPVVMDSAFTVQALVPLSGSAGDWRFAATSLGSVYFFRIMESESGFSVSLEQTIDSSYPGFGRNVLPLPALGESYVFASTDHLYFAPQDATTMETLSLDGLVLPEDDAVAFNVPFLGTFEHAGDQWLVVGGSTDPGTGSHWALLFIDLADTSNRTLLTFDDTYPGEMVRTLKLTDLDGDGAPELFVGAGQNIYVFRNDQPSAALPFGATPDFTLHATDREVGQIIEFGDLTGNSHLEIIAADPSYQANGDKRLGSVSIYSDTFFDGGGPTASPLLSLSPNTDEEKKFGSSLITVPTVTFPGRDELVVGGSNSSYLYFITGIEGDDSPAADPR